MPKRNQRRCALLGFLVLLLTVSLSPAISLAESEWHTLTLAAETPFETPVHIQQTDVARPVVMIVGGMHGNEPAGAAAAEQIADWPIVRGTLIVVPRANLPALEIDKRLSPNVPEDQNNLNRNFVWADGQVQTLGPMAADLWKLVQSHQPDWVIDLHEGFDVNAKNKKSVGSSIIHDRSAEADAMAGLMLNAVNAEIADPSNHFVPLGPPVAGSLARAAGDHTHARSMIVETTTKDRRLSLRTRQHRVMVAAMLDELAMLPADVDANTIAFGPRTDGKTCVAVYDDGGASVNGVKNLLRVCNDQGNVVARRVCAKDIRAGVLEQFDVVCFGGGGGSNLSKSLNEEGRAAVRNFVTDGGDYLGVCAGAYLACSGFSWGLGILDARTKSNKWRRGRATLEVEFQTSGMSFFSPQENRLKLYYANGPILAPNNKEDLPDYEVLAWFREEVARNGTPAGIMVDSPAIVRGEFGEGDVFCFSPHPESTKGMDYLLQRVIHEQQRELANEQN